jgi:SAM-dependent methyltransferase
MLFNILHIEEPVKLLAEAYRVLTPGGRAAIIHWKHDPQTPRGPSLAIRPKPEQCLEWAEQVGFHFVRNEELCCCSWHWGMVVERPAP